MYIPIFWFIFFHLFTYVSFLFSSSVFLASVVFCILFCAFVSFYPSLFLTFYLFCMSFLCYLFVYLYITIMCVCLFCLMIKLQHIVPTTTLLIACLILMLVGKV
jgi:hypothetical protein